MNVSILVCTYGSPEWAARGREALDTTVGQGADQAFVCHSPNGTLASVRNRAAEAATGEWLLMLDADDSLAVGYLAAMRSANASVSGPALLVPAMQRVEDGQCVGRAEIPAWGRSLIDVNSCCIGTLVPRQLFLDVGGFGDEPIYEDWSLALRLVRAGAVLVPVPDAVYRATRRPGSRNVGPDAEATYWAIRGEHEPHFDWANVRGYKR